MRVRTPDGWATFPDDMPTAEVERVLAREYPRNMPRSSNPEGRRVGAQTLTAETPDVRAYRTARAREARIRDERGGMFDGFNRFTQQIPANLGIADEMAAGSAFLGQGATNIARRVTGRPIEIPADIAARAAADDRNARAEQYRSDAPELDTLATIAGVPAMAGAPTAALALPMGAVRAGVTAAGVNAPFAFARQEGSLQERLPGAALETAGVLALGTGAQGIANRLMRPPLAASGRARAAAFEQAGVRPTLAAVNGGAYAGATKLASENFLAGGRVRQALQNSLDDTATASRNIAGQYGQHGQPEQVGEVVQRGVERFARGGNEPMPVQPRVGRAGNVAAEGVSVRDWSFRAKANALYDNVFERITADEVQHLAGQTGVSATTDATERVLAQIQRQVSAPNVAELVSDPTIARIGNAVTADRGALRFNDLRRLRTWVREARTRPGLTQTVDQASLARLESALTEDIYTSAIEIGGEAAAQQLRRVDQFYRAGQQRIERALEPFARGGGAQAYRRVIDLARQGGRQNARALQSLRNSLRPAEWREVAATIIDDMGRPTAGNPAALEAGAFSVEQFVTNYAKLSADGRRILFGGAGTQALANELDNLVRVAGFQKGVEAMANRSRSGINVQNVGTGAGLLNPTTTAPTAGFLVGLALTGEMLTNPAFVRWLTSAARGGAGGVRLNLAGLAQLAGRDPALVPFYESLIQRVGDQSQPRQGQQPARIGSTQ